MIRHVLIMFVIVLLFSSVVYGANSLYPTDSSSLRTGEGHCPQDLSYQEQEMEKILQYVLAQEFKETIRASLRMSIPEAIRQSDGIKEQITFLKREIMVQDTKMRYAEGGDSGNGRSLSRLLCALHPRRERKLL